eukprot:GHVR01155070.1.p1 GENE.GHVR01155070.1~~GHVR01155070.1.p1  ORF type:complete len:172 (+),score=51.69 GHVR01155070.1:96-611(+)
MELFSSIGLTEAKLHKLRTMSGVGIKNVFIDAGEVADTHTLVLLMKISQCYVSTDVIKYGFSSRECRGAVGVMLGAANGNKTSTLRWLVETHNFDFSTLAWWELVGIGRGVHRLLSHGQVVCCNAAKRGCIDVLEYMLNDVCVCVCDEIYEHAKKGCMQNVLRWLDHRFST